jgi:hypothetical protein
MRYTSTTSAKVRFTSSETTTENVLTKAFNGDIPAIALEKLDLDRHVVSVTIGRELHLLHSAAIGAKMHFLALLLYQVHAALIQRTNDTPQK